MVHTELINEISYSEIGISDETFDSIHNRNQPPRANNQLICYSF